VEVTKAVSGHTLISSRSHANGLLNGETLRKANARPDPIHSYWEFLLLLPLSLLIIHTLLRPTSHSLYTHLIGYLGLAIEAILPLPQIFANQRAKSCKGFRVSVLANWLLGDAMKMGFFFTSDAGKVPWAFKMCGIFQACCDAGLGVQYWVYGDGPGEVRAGEGEKSARLG
jgi:hypothetical protein